VALEVGIVGPAGSGKTSLFTALTRTGGGEYGKTNVGMAPIADARLDALAQVVSARKITPATIRIQDVPGAGEAQLGNLRQVDALLVVLAGFGAGADPSGDLETFNQLFPLGHAYFGYIDVIGRQNIIDLHPGLELQLLKEARHAKKVTLRAEHHLFWRESDDDAVYSAAGTVLRADNGSGAAYIGQETDLLLNWQIDRHWSAYVGYSHFFPGDFIQETGPAGDIDFVYAALQFTF